MPLLLLTIVFFLLSLLTVFPAPEYHLWMVAIMVTEFSWIFVAVTALLLVLVLRADHFRITGAILAASALLLFASPVLRAFAVAGSIDKDMQASLGQYVPGTYRNEASPFRVLKMFTGIGAEQIMPTAYDYAAYPGVSLTLDFYAAPEPGKRPCVIVIHGGSWRGGDNKQMPELNTWLAAKGYHVAAVNYRKAPAYKSPAPVEDVRAAMQWLREHSAALAIDTGNFILLGRSAGAQIALMAAYGFHDPAVRGVISFYGPADMVWGYSLPANPLVMDSRKVMEDYLGGTYPAVPQQYHRSSATEAVSAAAPATLMIHGLNDPLVAYEHNTRLIKKLEAYHRPYFLLTLPWATHGCDYTLNGPSGQLSTYAIGRFLEAVIPPGPSWRGAKPSSGNK